MSNCISAIGTANPKHRILQDDTYHFMAKACGLDDNNKSRLKHIYDNSGIKYRYSVLPDFGDNPDGENIFFNVASSKDTFPGTSKRMDLYRSEAAPIAVSAAIDCMKNFGQNIFAEITHLITVSCTGMYAPGIDIELVDLLGLTRSVERTCINFMGCYGALNALKTADYICSAKKESKVLIVCIELCTLHFQNQNTLDNWVANSLFSDGAAAVLVENSANKKTKKGCLNLDTFYSEFLPSGNKEMGWYIGDKGFEMKLTSKVSKLIAKNLHTVALSLLAKAGLHSSDLDAYAVHPGGRKILEAAETALGFSAEGNRHGYEILKNYGNMSSATILFVLKRFMDEPQIKNGRNIPGFAFGPGLTVESMILKTAGYA